MLIFKSKAGRRRAGSSPPSAPLRGRSSPVLAMLAMLGAKRRLRVAPRGSGPPAAELEPSRSPAFPIAISNHAEIKGKPKMTQLSNGTIVTDVNAAHDNDTLTAQGYSIRAVETWHNHDTICILWDAPAITEADCPF